MKYYYFNVKFLGCDNSRLRVETILNAESDHDARQQFYERCKVEFPEMQPFTFDNGALFVTPPPFPIS